MSASSGETKGDPSGKSGEKAAGGAIALLQRLVDGFGLDVGRLRAALDDAQTPPGSRRTLVGALNYVLDALDIFPDHYQGLGLVDDALVLRLAAVQAVTDGAAHRGLRQLAADDRDVRAIVGSSYDGLYALVQSLAERPVRGRAPAQILADPDMRSIFEADLNRLSKRHQTAKIEPIPGSDLAVLEELQRMIRAALKREKA
jgi:uncharacterized membrane protein YkvA (DUF1232 family)